VRFGRHPLAFRRYRTFIDFDRIALDDAMAVDRKGAIGPQEFADTAVELFLNGFAPGDAAKPAAANRRETV
jgi:hypothetical protein